MTKSAHKSLPTQPDPMHRMPVRAIIAFGRLYARCFHSLRVLTPNQLPKTGPAILVCNHTSGLDPVLIQSACSRLIVWMMAKEYYEIATIKRGFEMIEAIPVERSGRDLSSTRSALRALQAGRILGVFPEGRIEPDKQLLPFHTGVAMMAQKTKVDVYPAYLDGTQRGADIVPALSRPHRAILAFGPAVMLEKGGDRKRPDTDLDAATATIRASVEKLRAMASSLQR